MLNKPRLKVNYSHPTKTPITYLLDRAPKKFTTPGRRFMDAQLSFIFFRNYPLCDIEIYSTKFLSLVMAIGGHYPDHGLALKGTR